MATHIQPPACCSTLISTLSDISDIIGTLKVVRLTDARSLYPFDGAEEIGPFPKVAAAKGAALARGPDIIRADLESPEL